MLLRRRGNSLDRCFHLTAAVLLLDVLLADLAEWCNAGVALHCQTNIPATSVVKVFKNKCYSFISDEKFWTDANKTCVQYGAHLVKNNNEEINSFLTSALNELTSWHNNGVWIGLHDRNKEQKWEWTTGKKGVHEPVSWTNWATGHPKSLFHSSRDCVRMTRSGGKWLWVDTPCGAFQWHYRFICEYDALNSASADSFREPDNIEASMIYFAIFGAVAVIVCVTGTAGGLIVYKIFRAKRQRVQTRDRSERSQEETSLQRAPPNLYVKFDEVCAQKRLQDAARSSEDDLDSGSAIYEEVSYPATTIRQLTSQDQNVSADCTPMNSESGSDEVRTQEEPEAENLHLGPCSPTSNNGPVCTNDIAPVLNSPHREHDIAENNYEEIGLDQRTRSCIASPYPPEQTLRISFCEDSDNVSNHQNVSHDSDIDSHIYEHVDNVITT